MGRERGRAADREPGPSQQPTVARPTVHQRLVHGGDGEQHAGAVLAHRVGQVGGGEPGTNVGRAAGGQNRVHAGEPVLVEQRQGVGQHVVLAPAPGRHGHADRDEQLAVGQRHGLGTAGRARGVGEQRGVTGAGHDRGASRRPGGDLAGIHGQRRVRQPGEQPRGAAVRERDRRAGVGDQVREFARGVAGVGEHDDRTRTERAQVTADETEAGPGGKQHPVSGSRPGREPGGDPAAAASSVRVGDLLPVDHQRDPVRHPARGRGGQPRDGGLAEAGTCAGMSVTPGRCAAQPARLHSSYPFTVCSVRARGRGGGHEGDAGAALWASLSRSCP